ncbi:hypothetical protein ABW286_11525 [Erwinia papayae]|uniref:Uncharacterized protein n=1 Tax=Erwinia papayae TaxID=206499 RepID=A0ABV3N259_9GAMM
MKTSSDYANHHRKTTGLYYNKLASKQPSRKEYNEQITALASNPGANSGNFNKRERAGAILAFAALVSNIPSPEKVYATTKKSAEKQSINNLLINLYSHQDRIKPGQKSDQKNSSDDIKKNFKTPDNKKPENIINTPPQESMEEKFISEMNDSEKHTADLHYAVRQTENHITPLKNEQTVLTDLISSVSNLVNLPINEYDLLKFPAAHGHAISNNNVRPETSQPKAPEINHKINRILKNEGLIKTSNEKPVPLSSTLNGVANYLDQTPEKSSKLARAILREFKKIDIGKDQPISDTESKFIINNWLSEQVLKTNLSNFVAQKIANNEFLEEFTSYQFKNLLSADSCLPHESHKPLPTALRNMWENYIEQAVPLFSIERTDNMRVTDFEWGFMYAGALYLQQAGASNEDITQESASYAGKMLFSMLEDNAVPDEIKREDFFRIPALFHYANDHRVNWNNIDQNLMTDISREACKELFNKFRAHINDNVFNHFNEAMSAWKPRLEVVNDFKVYMWNKDKLSKPGTPNNGYPWRTIENKLTDPVPSDLVDQKYAQLTGSVASKYADVDRLLVISVLGECDKEDFDFISQAHVKSVNVHITAMDELKNRHVETSQAEIALITSEPHPGVSIFAAEKGEVERIYALRPDENGYSLHRVDRDKDSYYWENLMSDNKGLKDQEYKLHILSADLLKTHQEGMEVLINSLVKEHREKFYKSLYQQGDGKAPIEKIGDFMLSLIPFYDCSKSIRSADASGAAISCSLDILSFIPVVGKIASISGKFASSAAMGVSQLARTAMTTATRDAFQSGVFKLAIKNAGQQALRDIALPGKKQLSSVGIEIIEAADPGFELLWRAGKISNSLLIAISKKINSVVPAKFEQIIKKLKIKNLQKTTDIRNNIDNHIQLFDTKQNKWVDASAHKAGNTLPSGGSNIKGKAAQNSILPVCAGRGKRGLDELCRPMPDMYENGQGVVMLRYKDMPGITHGVYPPSLKNLNPERYKVVKDTMDNVAEISASAIRNLNKMSDTQVVNHFSEITGAVASAEEIKAKTRLLSSAVDIFNNQFDKRLVILDSDLSEKGVMASYNSGVQRIFLNENTFTSSQPLTHTLIHEISHSVDTQDYLYYDECIVDNVFQPERVRIDENLSDITDKLRSQKNGEEVVASVGNDARKYFNIPESMPPENQLSFVEESLRNNREKAKEVALNNADTFSAYFMSLAGLGKKSQTVNLNMELALKDTSNIYAPMSSTRSLRQDLLRNNLIEQTPSGSGSRTN